MGKPKKSTGRNGRNGRNGSREIGRPTKLTKELTSKIAKHVEEWLPFEKACLLCGINERYLYRWREYGERDEKAGKQSIFTSFCQEIKKAQAKAESEALKDIRGKVNNWQASAWLLERRHHERYGRRVVNEMVGKDGGAIRIEEQRRDVVAQTQGTAAIRKQFRRAYDTAQEHLEKVNGSESKTH
jgi:hypothetical protein